MGPASFRWHRRWTNEASETRPFDGALELVSVYEPTWTMIPGVSYGGNSGDGNEPKGLTENGVPWVYAANRVSVPAATYSESDTRGWSIALFTADDEASLNGSCALKPEGDGVVHRLCWPERELPRQYAARDTYTHGWRAVRYLESGESFETTCYLVLRPVECRRSSWRSTLDCAWGEFDHDVDAWYDPERLWELGLRFARESLWQDTEDFTGFCAGIGREAGEWTPRALFEIGWVGQNGALATAFLHDYHANGNEKSLRIGERTLDHWAEIAPLDCGLFRTRFNPRTPFEDAHSASGDRWVDNLDTCNLGHGAYQFLLGAELAEECGCSHPEWRVIALDALDFLVENQLDDDTFGKVWSFDGECLDETGTVGAFVIWALLKAYRVTDDERYVRSAKTAFDTYTERDLERMVPCCSGS